MYVFVVKCRNVDKLSYIFYIYGVIIIRLSKNFTLSELCFSATALINKISNNPSSYHTLNLINLCMYSLESIRMFLNHPIKITSGYRCSELNAIVGGVLNSQHTKGEASDFYCNKSDQYDLKYYLKKKECSIIFDQIIFYEERNFVHVSYSSEHNRGDILKSPSKGIYNRL